MSCLFDSIGHLLGLTGSHVRSCICDYLEKNGKLMDGIETHTILDIEAGQSNSYIHEMRKPYTWGGGIEIQSACNIWSVRIVIQNRRNHEHKHIEFIPSNSKYNHTLVMYWTGAHYEPLHVA